jgi:hypothetical protein
LISKLYLPTPIIDPLEAINAASPPLDPPGDKEMSIELEVVPQRGFEHSKDINVWGTFVLTNGIPPSLMISWTSEDDSDLGEKQYLTSPTVEST